MVRGLLGWFWRNSQTDPLAWPRSLRQVGLPIAQTRDAIPQDNPQTPAKILLGEKLFFDGRLSADGSVACATCHGEWVYPNEEAPNLYGWGSPWWIRRMIERPGSLLMYGYLDPAEQMPSFRDQMTSADLETLIRYLKNDYLGAEPTRTAGGHCQHARPDSLETHE